MGRIDKTIFLSYRRIDVAWALAIFQYLIKHGYDVFFDFKGIASGDFERVIVANIKARAHFLVLLTPSALERSGEINDWLRREIETALATGRNIVPVALQGFNFATPSIAAQLSGKLALLSHYNALEVPAGYFDEAMDRLREKYLNIPLDAVLHPASPTALQATQVQQAAAFAALQEPGELSQLVANVRSEGVMPEVSRFDHNGLEYVERELAGYVGPIAKLLVKRAAVRATSWIELYSSLANEIAAGLARERFVRSASTMQKQYPLSRVDARGSGAAG